MDSTFQRALRKLNIEHQLDLRDPDSSTKSLGNALDYELCRDAKDLWLYQKQRWDHVMNRFYAQAPSLRSQWIPKPLGDLTTTSFRGINETTLLKDLLRRLLQEENAGYGPPSTIPFPPSEEQEMILLAAHDDRQAIAQLSVPVNASQNGQYLSSLDMFSQPASSWLDEFEQLEQNDNQSRVEDVSMAHGNDDDLDMDYAAFLDEPKEFRRISDATPERTDKWSRNISHGRKRGAPTSETETCPRKPKAFGDHQSEEPEFDSPAFSFNKPEESFATKTSVNNSFRSIFTDVNESFDTNATSRSFHPQAGRRVSSTNALSRPKIDRTMSPDKVQKYLDMFRHASPFDESMQACPQDASLSTAFEIQRVALHNDFNSVELFRYLRSQAIPLNAVTGVPELNRLWAALSKYITDHEGCMPAKSSEKAWKSFALPQDDFEYSRILLSGSVSLGLSEKDPLLELKLNPLSLDQSNRLKRKYGSDRVLVLLFPSLDGYSVPGQSKDDCAEVRLALLEWLTSSSHYLFGREWRAFYVKSKPRTKSAEKSAFAWKVYFFAVHGHGFIEYVKSDTPKRVSVEQMLDWFLSITTNQTQHSLKLFSRLQLLVSDTKPTITFAHSQIIQRDDIECQGAVMTDGCARISLKAAQEIARHLDLSLSIPSAFQARIAGAKGMWVVDSSWEPRDGLDIWIEMSPSQIKFESLARDKVHPDKARMTFEVHDYSRPLRPATLNFQLLPILIDRNVDSKVFTDLLKADLDLKVTELGEALSRPQALRAWNQEQFPHASSRLSSDGIEWDGGMPRIDEEMINVLTEAGYTPATCQHLKELCTAVVSAYCARVQKRVALYPGNATYAYMIPDFWGVLEEDQIHLGFSSAFVDKQTKWSDTMVHSMDVLVARLPASLPSDIHKVRAVFKPELAHLKDVVVFPTKGSFCLADKLSGGDYDGDKAWICWNDAIVKPFRNFATPDKKDYTEYGIQKDKTLVKDVWQPKNKHDRDTAASQAHQAIQFIMRGFEFNMRKSHLGRCTNQHEAYCYKLVLQAEKSLVVGSGKQGPRSRIYSPIHDRKAMELANLLGYLVDTAKNGFTFTHDDCDKYLASIGAKKLPDPAYKIEKGQPSSHILDQLVLVTAVEFRQQAIKKLDDIVKDCGDGFENSFDKDLKALFQNEKRLAETSKDPAVSLVLRKLAHDVQEICDLYSTVLVPKYKDKIMSWREVNEELRRNFSDLQPASGFQNGMHLDDHPLIQRWHKSTTQDNLSTQQSWRLLAASAVYEKKALGSFPWAVCGKELMALKLLVNNNGVSITQQMHQFFKFDRRMWENAKLLKSTRNGAESEDEIERLDPNEFTEFDTEMMYESQAEAE